MYIDYNDKYLLYVHIEISILFDHFIYCKFYNYEKLMLLIIVVLIMYAIQAYIRYKHAIIRYTVMTKVLYTLCHVTQLIYVGYNLL